MGLLVAALVLLASWVPQCSLAAAEDPRQERRSEAKGDGDRGGTPGQSAYPSPALISEPEDLQPKRSLGEADADKQRGQDGEWNWDQPATITNALSAFMIMVFTYLLVRHSGNQARATAESVEAMRESTRVAERALEHARDTAKATLEDARRATNLTLRAWLVIDKIYVVETNPPGFPNTIWLRIAVTNAGRLPAVSVAAALKPETIPAADPPLVAYPDRQGPEGVVVPAGTPKNFVFSVEHLAIERMDADDLFHFWFTVEFKYTDVLESAGETIQTAHYVRPESGHHGYIHLDRDGTTMN